MLNQAAQAAVELMYEDGSDLPQPTAIEQWTSNPAYADGFWMLVEIDVSRPTATYPA